ncbi:MAG: TatD family hydrolase [Candidatus Asgardarchaeia archaeon]
MLYNDNKNIPYVDAHTHFYEYSEKIIEKIKQTNILVVGVSDDILSSEKTIALAKQYSFLIPCVGFHPWTFEDKSVDINFLLRKMDLLINKHKVRCIGEVGLDKRYGEKTYNLQVSFFKGVLEIASEMNLVVNIHALDTWHDAFQLLTNYSIKKAIFHWYTGPINLLKDIESQGYYITLNPSIVIQKKHRKVAEVADISHILTESDGPYNYRKLFLHSGLVPALVKQLADIRNENEVVIRRNVYYNFKRYFIEQ